MYCLPSLLSLPKTLQKFFLGGGGGGGGGVGERVDSL